MPRTTQPGTSGAAWSPAGQVLGSKVTGDRFLRYGLLTAVAVVAVGLASLAHSGGWLRSLELDAVDTRYQLRGEQSPRSDIAIVGVDAESLQDLGARLPLPRSLHAQLIRTLHRGQPRLIAYDIQFIGKTTERADRALIKAITMARPVLLATHDTANGPVPVPADLHDPARIGAVLGSAAVADEPDGKVRRLLYGQIASKTFSVRAAELVRASPVAESEFLDGAAWIDFQGPPGTISTYSFSDVLSGRVPPARFRDRVVVVGVTDPVAKDLFITPASERSMSGAELQANSITTVLDGFRLRSAPGWLDALIIVLSGSVPALLALRSTILPTVGLSLLMFGGVVAGAQLAFNGGTIVTVTYPALGLVLSTVGAAAVTSLTERREHQRLRELFAKFDATVVAQVLATHETRQGRTKGLDADSIIAGYRIHSLVGQGGMGVVYRATQLVLNRPVAVKLIRPEHANDIHFRERFRREWTLASAIDHPNILPVYDAGEDDGLLFIAMRFVDGSDLQDSVERSRMQPRRLLEIVTQVAAALDAARAKGLVHRDVKPSNILVTPEGGREHAYLTDFGVAKYFSSSAHQGDLSRWLGSVDYVAPEQIDGTSATDRADIYSLGATLYYGLTGQVPYPRDDTRQTVLAHLNAPPPRPSTITSGLSMRFDGVIGRAMAKDPADRYRSASELAAAARDAAAPRAS